MTVIPELDWVDIACLAIAVLGFVVAAVKALGWLRLPAWFDSDPTATALYGLGLTAMIFGKVRNEVGEQFFEGWAFLILLCCVLAGVTIDKRSRASSPHHQPLQRTLDPADPSVDAEALSASSAAQLKR